MKRAVQFLGVLSASGLLALPAHAQIASGLQADRLDSPETQAAMFLRIPLGDSPREEGLRFGFALFTGCSTSLGLTSERNRDACSARPLRALEFSTGFNDQPWALSFASAGRRIDFLNWSPQTGRLSVGEEGSNNWLWWGLGAAAGIGIAAALSSDDDPTLCPDGFVANPISGQCEPIG